jgi:hypothetical protein
VVPHGSNCAAPGPNLRGRIQNPLDRAGRDQPDRGSARHQRVGHGGLVATYGSPVAVTDWWLTGRSRSRAEALKLASIHAAA